MSDIRQLADGNVGSSLSNGINGPDDELEPFRRLRNELDVIVNHKLQELIGPVLESAVICAVQKMIEPIVIRTVKNLIEPVLEPMMRRVVKEQIELAKERILTSMNQNSAERLNSSQPRRLKLRFGNTLSHKITTGSPITGEDGTPVRVELVDENTGSIVKVGPEASSRVKIVVLQMDPDGLEELNQVAVRERGGKKSLVLGDAYLNLDEGVGVIGKISFTHKSDWTKKCKLMLGAQLMGENGVSVAEAKSEAFTLLDRRCERHEKHHPPSTADAVWRLKNISIKGAYNKRLMRENIRTVKDFLREYYKNRRRLKEILQMSDEKLNATLEHALNCKELEKWYLYYIPGSQKQSGIVFNIVGQLLGQICECRLIPINDMSETQKENAQELVASAFEHWGDVVAYSEDCLSRSSARPIASSSNTVPSDSHVGTSAKDAGPEHTRSSTPLFSVDNRHDEMQPITASAGDVTLINDSSDNSVGRMVDASDPGPPDITRFGVGDNLQQWASRSPSPTHWPDLWALPTGFNEDSGFEYCGISDDRLDHEEREDLIRKWLKMFLVLKFFLRMRMDQDDANHFPKRTRFH